MGRINLLYLILIPLALLTLYKRGVEIATCIREKNYSGLKSALFFLGISMLVLAGTIWIIEYGMFKKYL
jgi:hypothetical protein